ncbi:MAG TPA: SCO family protein [Acidobacteriota bacterium]|nr:SCO family protein [Acidobacteriota bacterium]
MRKILLAGLAAAAVAAAGLFIVVVVLAVHSRAPATKANDGRGGSIWGANYFPNVPLTTHEGKKVRFFDDLIKDKVVCINFIYTNCPDSCPMETAKLREVARLLGDRVGKDIFFYSITIDPGYDTPEVLAAYVKKFQIGPGWLFLTGKKDDITLLRKKFGIYMKDDEREKPNDHNLSMIVGNQSTGRWQKSSPFENPYIMATQLGNWLHNGRRARKTERDFADAPEIRNIVPAEDLFRTRCASCHTIGKGDVDDIERRLVGPDLLNVTSQRDRKWLMRWLLEPDKMLEEKDPLAIALFKQYQEVPMPNLRLGRQDAEQMLDFLEAESRRVEAQKKGRQSEQ